MLRAYGAELVLTDPMEGSDGAIREARRIYARDRRTRTSTPTSTTTRRTGARTTTTTGAEILEQTDGRLTHFVAGLGTSGTFVGTGRRLREWRPSVRADLGAAGLAAPRARRTEAHGVGDRAGHLRSVARRRGSACRDRRRARADAAARARGRAARRSVERRGAGGVPRGRAPDLGRGVIVTIFPDGGDRYLSERVLDDGALVDGRTLRPAPTPRRAIRAARARRRIRTSAAARSRLARAARCVEALPLDNDTDGERRRRFLVDAAGLSAGRGAGRRARRRALGFYHSHPDHPAVPSQFDLDHAWPNLSYVIVSVRDGRPGELRSWRLRRRSLAFDEEAVDAKESHMAVIVRIPTPLRPFTGQQASVEVDGATVGEVLAAADDAVRASCGSICSAPTASCAASSTSTSTTRTSAISSSERDAGERGATRSASCRRSPAGRDAGRGAGRRAAGADATTKCSATAGTSSCRRSASRGSAAQGRARALHRRRRSRLARVALSGRGGRRHARPRRFRRRRLQQPAAADSATARRTSAGRKLEAARDRLHGAQSRASTSSTHETRADVGERARDLQGLRRHRRRRRQLPDALSRQRRLRAARQAERLRQHLPLRRPGVGLRDQGRPVLSLPVSRAAAARARAELRRRRRARRAARASSARFRRPRRSS